jgi:hypothetical protein
LHQALIATYPRHEAAASHSHSDGIDDHHLDTLIIYVDGNERLNTSSTGRVPLCLDNNRPRAILVHPRESYQTPIKKAVFGHSPVYNAYAAKGWFIDFSTAAAKEAVCELL